MKLRLLFLIVLLPLVTALPQEAEDWIFSGQIQLRTELDGRDFSNETYPLTFTSMRTRVGVEKWVTEHLGFFVQFQDSRVFGQEPNTLASISNVDLHQGFLKMTCPEKRLTLQAGRFELIYGTERFFGAVGWNYIARSFDGGRLTLNFLKPVKFDLFALTTSENVPYLASAVPGNYPYPSVPSTSSSIYGFWSNFALNQMNNADVFGYYEVNRTNTTAGDNILDLFTVGINHNGKYGALSSILEAAYQTGTQGTQDIAAYLASLQLHYGVGTAKFGLGADILSGTEPEANKYNTFRPTYGTNHKFYGYMDYFISMPANTLNLGLNDFYALLSYQPEGIRFGGSLMVHHFMANADSGGDDINNVFGQEVDLTVKYNLVKGTVISWGGSVFFPGDLMKIIYTTPGAQREDIAYWSYLMVTANL